MQPSPITQLIDAIPLPAIFINPDERIVHLNSPAGTLFGAASAGRHYITALRQPTLLDWIERVLTGTLAAAETQYLGNEAGRDTTYVVKIRAVIVGEVRHVLVTFEDVTALQEIGQLRRDFVANVSHELKTPLTALLGFIETLRSSARDDPEARERFLEIMQGEASRMNRLVRDLLSLSRVEADERMRPMDIVDVAELCRTAVASLTPIAREFGATLELDDHGPVEVPGDEDQLRQVISNLVENSIKYAGGSPTIRITIAENENDPTIRGRAVAITVEDDGEGLDPVHIPRLTERFYRIDTHRSREMGGTGLGLAIVKHIVNRHRGRLRIESTPGEGSRFSVILSKS
ncbi:MAG: ATP-binding protein [Pseudomonadota bacterium]